MKTRPGILITALTWAVLLGLATFIAFFYRSITSAVDLELRTMRQLSAEDSLLFASYDLLALTDGGLAPTQVLRSVHQSIWTDLDSLATLRVAQSHPGFDDAVRTYRTYADNVVWGRRLPDKALRVALFGGLRTEFRKQAAERLEAADRSFLKTFNTWVWVAIIVSLLGFWFFLFLFRKERTRESAYERLASIVRIYDDPVVVYDDVGNAQFANDAARKAFELMYDGSLRRLDRLGHLQDLTDGDGPGLWERVRKEIESSDKWSGQVESTTPGGGRHFHVHGSRLAKEGPGPSEYLIVHSDITEHVRLRQRAEDAEDQYRSLVEDSPEAIVLIYSGRVEYANRAAVRLFGFSERDDLTGPGFVDLFGTAGTLAFDVSLDGRSPGEEILKGAEFRATTRKGRMVDVEASATVVRWKDLPTLQATFRDITDRKVLEREQALWAWEQDALREIDKRLVGIVDLGRILEAIALQVTNLSRAPWAAIIMFSESRRHLRWRAMSGNNTAFDAARRFEVTPTILAMFSAPQPMVIQELGNAPQYSLSMLPGIKDEELVSSVWLPLSIEGRVEGALTVGYRSFHTFSEREMRLLSSLAEKTSIAIANAALYENLLQREKELEVLSGARVDAQEEERRRIAREIHDGLGQILTAIKLNVEILEDSSEIRKQDRETLADVKNLLDTVMKEAREISYNLMPSVLDDFGLAPALQLLGERFSGQSGVRVEFYGKSEGARLDPRMEVALYRIAQEALNNAVRHGEANLVTLQLSRSGQQLRLSIEDNGRGMDEVMPRLRRAEGGGIGIASMRERVNSFNGTLTIDSSPGKGTIIIVDLPLEKTDEKATVWQRSGS